MLDVRIIMGGKTLEMEIQSAKAYLSNVPTLTTTYEKRISKSRCDSNQVPCQHNEEAGVTIKISFSSMQFSQILYFNVLTQ
jgi:hypothetical protein